MSMSTSISAKLYLKLRLNELMIHDVSNFMLYISGFKKTIGHKVLVDVIKFKDEDNDMILLCFLPPLLTALLCFKERISRGVRSKGNAAQDRWLEVISWEPKAFVYHNFLTNEECDHLISLAKPRLAKSLVRDRITGEGKESSERTSAGAFLGRKHDKIVEEIEKRKFRFHLHSYSAENGRGLQVIHYEVGQKFDPHFDGSQRIATVLMYLSDVEEGGETVFPNAKRNNRRQKISVLPKKRDALLFWNMRPDGSIDPSSKHGGCPVIKGNKWASTKGLHGCGYNKYKATMKTFSSLTSLVSDKSFALS